MFGNNPILPPEQGDGGILKIHSLFRTFQGEGPYSGYPAIFIRLSGCNLACTFCDTEFDTFKEMPLDLLMRQTLELAEDKVKLAVITGGEPFRQNIAPLCELLVANGFAVQIESNGTLYRPLHPNVAIVCSPKNTGMGYKPIRKDLLGQTIAIKFIVSANDSKYSDIGEVGQESGIPVYIQPMDEYDIAKNKANMKLALGLAEKYGHRIGIQAHKVLNIE